MLGEEVSCRCKDKRPYRRWITEHTSSQHLPRDQGPERSSALVPWCRAILPSTSMSGQERNDRGWEKRLARVTGEHNTDCPGDVRASTQGGRSRHALLPPFTALLLHSRIQGEDVPIRVTDVEGALAPRLGPSAPGSRRPGGLCSRAYSASTSATSNSIRTRSLAVPRTAPSPNAAHSDWRHRARVPASRVNST